MLAARERPIDLSVSLVATVAPLRSAVADALRGEQRAFDLHEVDMVGIADTGVPHSGLNACCNLVHLRQSAEVLEWKRWSVGAPDRQRRALPAVAVLPLEHDPMRRHTAFGSARHHKTELGGFLVRQELLEQLAQTQSCKAPAEIVHQPVAFGLCRTQRPRPSGRSGPRRSPPRCRNVVRSARGNAMHLRDRHVRSPAPSVAGLGEVRVRSWGAGMSG